MGFFKNAAETLGMVDHKLLASGVLARGEVVSVDVGAMTVGGTTIRGETTGGSTVCLVTVRVIGFEDRPPYEASAHAPIPRDQIAELQFPGAAIAVRVNPSDPEDIALDLHTDPPAADSGAAQLPTAAVAGDGGVATEGGAQVVLTSDDGSQVPLTTHASKLTAAEILAQGAPCTITVLAVIPIDQLNARGETVTGLVLNAHRPGRPDVQAQIGTHIPPEVTSRVVVGATLPARFTPGLDTGDDSVVPDWNLITP